MLRLAARAELRSPRANAFQSGRKGQAFIPRICILLLRLRCGFPCMLFMVLDSGRGSWCMGKTVHGVRRVHSVGTLRVSFLLLTGQRTSLQYSSDNWVPFNLFMPFMVNPVSPHVAVLTRAPVRHQTRCLTPCVKLGRTDARSCQFADSAGDSAFSENPAPRIMDLQSQ